MSKTASTEYLFSSARVRALETRLLGNARLAQLADVRTLNELSAALGQEAPSENTRLKNAFDSVAAMIPDASVIRFLQYPYDCHNVKATIKCFARAEDPAGMLFTCGTVAPEEIERLPSALMSGGQDAARAQMLLPPHMADAAPEAAEVFARTKQAQAVDFLLDRACFADMLSAAEAVGEYAVRLVRCRIDTRNVLTACRLARMKSQTAALWDAAVLPGGTLDTERLGTWATGGEDRVPEWLAATDYAPLVAAYAETGTLAAPERAADNLILRTAQTAKTVAFGVEVVLGYLVAVETEIKNLRILRTGRAAGLSAGEIRERLRESYG